MDDEEDEEADAEGSLFRCFFRTESDSEDDQAEPPFSLLVSTNDVDSNNAEATISTRQVLHVTLQERSVGAAISERLWPAATFLAEYVLGQTTTTGPTSDHAHHQDPRAAEARQALQEILSDSTLSILELGAGVGLTGLELATQRHARVLLTDLPVALPLLHANIKLNQDQFQLGPDAVKVQRLEWGNVEDARRGLEWFDSGEKDSTCNHQQPLLMLGSDCVYFESLHRPLEETLCHVLSSAPPGSMALLAGMRRWKRDTAFYKSLGKATRTTTHSLQCCCIKEVVERTETFESRQILRIYAVRWMERQGKR